MSNQQSERDLRVDIILWAHRRATNAENAGGMEDPYFVQRHVDKKFGKDAWRVVQELIASGHLATDGELVWAPHRG